MTNMDFFRRPSLVGKNMTRLQQATVRGSVRRADADGTSLDPYFPLITGGMPLNGALTVKIDGVTKTVDLITSNKFADVMTDIQTALGASGTVVDTDGTLSIKTATLGGGGSVEITGGTQAAFLGFDITNRGLKSIGGEMFSSPEGRRGNPFGTAFPGRSEDLNIESIQRVLGRLSANEDVLYSEHVKSNAVLQKVSFSIDASRAFITPTASIRLFTGGPSASNVGSPLKLNAVRDYLAPFYFLVDADTHQPAPSRIIGVTRGAPSGGSYLVNSPSWSDTTGKNVMGLDLNKAAETINSITEGRFVKSNAATFITDGCLPGDFANISGATNLVPWSNNGYRWVVENVISETTLELRPMSRTELTQLGGTYTDTQPIVELNGDGPGSLGGIAVNTGMATSGVCLVCDPPLLPGANYELWAAVSTGMRDEKGWESLNGNFPASLYLNSNLDLLPNGVLSRPVVTLTGGGTTYSYTAFYARWHGKVIHIPAGSVPRTVGLAVTEYIYWDEKTAHVVTSTTALFNGSPVAQDPSASGTTSQGHLLYWFLDPAATPTLYPATKLEDTAAKVSLTVGHGGQFSTLQEAMNYVDALMQANGESVSATGPYSHFDVTVVSSLTVSSTVNVPAGVRLRGAHPGVVIKYTGSVSTALFQMQNTFILEDVQVAVDTAGADLIASLGTDVEYIRLRRVRQGGGIGAFRTAVSIAGNVFEVSLEECNLFLGGGVVWGVVNTLLTVDHCYFGYSLVAGVSPSLFNSSGGAGGFEVLQGIIRDSRFEGLTTLSGVVPILLDVSQPDSKWVISGNYFSFGTLPDSASVLIQTGDGTLFFSDNVVDSTAANGTVAQAILNSAGTVHVLNSSFKVQPVSFLYGVQATTIIGSTITAIDSPVVGRVNSTLLLVSSAATDNTLSGPSKTGIETGTGRVSVVGNDVQLTTGTHTGSPQYGILLKGTDSRIGGNYVTVSGGQCLATSGVTARNSISDNNLSGTGTTAYGIIASSASDYRISGNSIITTAAGSVGIYITVPSSFRIESNNITTPSDVATAGISVTGGSSMIIRDNRISSYAPLVNASGATYLQAHGNYLLGDLVTGMYGEFRGNFWTGNITFSGVGAFTGNSSVVGDSFSDCLSDSTCLVKVVASASCHVEFSSNRLLSGTRLEISGDVTSSFNIVGNYIDQSVTVTSGSDLGDVVFVSNRVGNGLTLSPTNGDKSVTCSGCSITGGATFGTKIKHLAMSGCEINGALLRNASTAGGSTRVSDTHVTSTTTLLGDSITVTNCFFDLAVSVSGGSSGSSAYGAVLSNCAFVASLQVEGSVQLSNCHINTFLGTVSGSAVASNTLLMTGCIVNGASTGLTSMGQVMMDDCYFADVLTIQGVASTAMGRFLGSVFSGAFNAVIADFSMDDCRTLSTFSNDLGVLTNNGRTYLGNSRFAGDVYVRGGDVVGRDCTLSAALSIDIGSHKLELISITGGAYDIRSGFVKIRDSLFTTGTLNPTSAYAGSMLEIYDCSFSGAVSPSTGEYNFIYMERCVITAASTALTATIASGGVIHLNDIHAPSAAFVLNGGAASEMRVTHSEFSTCTLSALDFLVEHCTGLQVLATTDATRGVVKNCKLVAGSTGNSSRPCIKVLGISESLVIHGNDLISDNRSAGSTVGDYTMSPCIMLGDDVSKKIRGMQITGNTFRIYDNGSTLSDRYYTGACIANVSRIAWAGGDLGWYGSMVLGTVSGNTFQLYAHRVTGAVWHTAASIWLRGNTTGYTLISANCGYMLDTSDVLSILGTTTTLNLSSDVGTDLNGTSY